MNTQQSKIIDKMLAEMESGTVPWQKPFFSMGKCNFASGHVYTGINRFMLANNSNPYYLTFDQAKKLKGHVKKGAKATTVVYWNIMEKEDKNGIVEKIPYMKTHSVFGIDQVDIPENTLEKLTADREIELQNNKINMDVEDFLTATRATIEHKDLTKAYYIPSEDIINLPNINQFKSSSSYYNTALHELSHWTGHESRLKRKFSTVYSGLEDYSKEELIAEISSSFLSQEFGIMDIERNSAYCESWLKALNNNKTWIFHCAGQAEKTINYLKQLVM